MPDKYKKIKKPFNLRTRTYNGYWQFYDRKMGEWVFVHRRVAEKKIGGKIGKDRVVHHKNKKKTDNRPSNLWVMRKSDHDKLHGYKG